MMTEKEYLFMISHAVGMGAVTIQTLRQTFSSFREIWETDEENIRNCGVLKTSVQDALLECRKHTDRYRREYERLLKDQIRYITYMDDGYPKRLQNFHDKPLFSKFYLQGYYTTKSRFPQPFL